MNHEQRVVKPQYFTSGAPMLVPRISAPATRQSTSHFSWYNHPTPKASCRYAAQIQESGLLKVS